MYFNQAKCDIYMGTGAGNKLLREIANAQKSVKIASPYLSPNLVKELVWLHKNGIKVSLITSDTMEGGNPKQTNSIKPLIVQHQKLDAKAQRTRNSLLFWAKALRWGSGLLTLGTFAVAFFAESISYLFLLLLPMALFWVSRILGRKAAALRIFDYDYHALFPFKVFVVPDVHRINSVFIHGKIYIIDGHTAYLGSLNFTESGTKYNYETRIRVTDVEAVKQIEAEFDAIYEDPEMAFFDIQAWGRRIFGEVLS